MWINLIFYYPLAFLKDCHLYWELQVMASKAVGPAEGLPESVKVLQRPLNLRLWTLRPWEDITAMVSTSYPVYQSTFVTAGATGATAVAPKFSDVLTLFQPGEGGGADSAQHRRGYTKNFPVVTSLLIICRQKIYRTVLLGKIGKGFTMYFCHRARPWGRNTLLNPARQDKGSLWQRIQIPFVVNFAKKMWIYVSKTKFS